MANHPRVIDIPPCIDRRIIVDFPPSDYMIKGRIVTGPHTTCRTYRIRNGEVMVKFDNCWWRIYEDEFTFQDGTVYRSLIATQDA